ncbi:GyrI-like domain-containing protein [Pseudomonas sp. dw_612]|uniref:GyrI-like domain-containing protein n=1 Tax=Pseudomonas sp. dw_612 TaxID=2720080 RepID=UPI001BD5AB98|nr:GyrI-like domain-containing protein [Pseudomonas sp. dw_612]
MEVKQVYVAPFSVSGLKVRTRNSAELAAETAKIGPMWGRFFSEGLNERIAPQQATSTIYGVYSGYESDASGAFDVTAGMAVEEPAQGYETINIEEGRYLVFEGTGPMPDTVISAWQSIWNYFEANPQIQRRFTTDFEAYDGPESVAVHLGIV